MRGIIGNAWQQFVCIAGLQDVDGTVAHLLRQSGIEGQQFNIEALMQNGWVEKG